MSQTAADPKDPYAIVPDEVPEDDVPAEFFATPTMSEFMWSQAYVRTLAGPVGGGKSVCCVHELMRMATTQRPARDGVRRTRFLIVRNTADQLRSTTFKTIKDWFLPEQFGRWAATERTIYYKFGLADGTIVDSEWMLRALDDEADVANALSLEVTAMWGNECRELHPQVVATLLKRTNRYPSRKSGGGFASRAGGIFDTNMPTLDTWWEQKMSDPPENWSVHIQPPAVLPLDEWIATYGRDPEPEWMGRTTDGDILVVDPNADNVANLAPTYYTDALRTDKKDDIDVYLRCKFGRTVAGLPVYDNTFRPHVHISKVPLEHVHSERYPIYVGVDFGRTPAALIAQATPGGRLLFLDEICEANMGMETFMRTKLRPLLNLRFPGMPIVVAPDPAGWVKGQGEEKAPVDYIKAAGFQVVRPPTNKPALRIAAMEAIMNQSAEALPRLCVDPRCKNWIKGARGAYKWATNKQGELSNEKEPVKNHPYSDIHDAAQYIGLVIDGDHAGRRSPGKRQIKIASAAGWS